MRLAALSRCAALRARDVHSLILYFAASTRAATDSRRRAKATSNICTNQGLLVTASTIAMAMLGPNGVERAAKASMNNTRKLRDLACAIPGVKQLYARPFFHEVALQLPKAAHDVVERLAREKIVAGFALGDEYPELENALLVCATETKTEADLQHFATALATALK